jgi:hypothetical protein
MRINQVPGNTADRAFINGKNVESSAIAKGVPVILRASTSDDGLAVVLPSTAGAAKTLSLFYGVTSDIMNAGDYGDLCAFGVCPYVLVARATRAASSDSWTSSASIASYAALNIDTVNNKFGVFSASAGASAFIPFAILLDSIASFAASATATTDSRTVLTTSVRAFLRML